MFTMLFACSCGRYNEANSTQENVKIDNKATAATNDIIISESPSPELSIDDEQGIGTVEETENSPFNIQGGILVEYTGKTSEVVEIPDTVTSIGALAFFGNSEVKKIIIPDSVESIGDVAFGYCSNLSEIVMPKTLTNFGGIEFVGTKWLENKLKESPYAVINGVLIDGLNTKGDITIPDSVKCIGKSAVEGNSDIHSVDIPDSVTTIEGTAFAGCIHLKKVTMADSVTSIGGEAFADCQSLTSIKLSDSLTALDGTFERCKKLESITLPSSLKIIRSTAFRHCKKLSKVTFPNTVISVDQLAFKFCKKGLTFYCDDNPFLSTFAEVNNIKIEKLSLNKTREELAVGHTLKLAMNSLADCSWESGNSKIATVSSNGKVTAKRKGKVTITALLYGKEYKCVVTVV